jgi:hypothetical protein
VALVGIGDAGAAVALNAYFLGGSMNDGATGVAFDPQGNIYLAGYTFSNDFPVVNAAQTAPGGGFVAKFTSDFSNLIYSTYVGSLMGPEPSSFPLAVTADAGGSAYVTGTTGPSVFTTTAGAFQTTAAGAQPAFALKLDPSGRLVFATFLGTGDGSGDNGNGIAVDASSNPYIVGFAGSANFPTTTGVVQPACTAHDFNGCTGGFVTKLNASGTGLVYSTFLGGGSGAYATSIALDSAGNAYVTGGTLTPNPVFGGVNFPTTPGAYQQTTQAGIAAFVSKLNATGTALVYSTLLAGPGPVPSGGGSAAVSIALDPSGGAYVTGWTEQSDFPLLDPLQIAIGSEQMCPVGMGLEICGDAFVSKLSPDGAALEWSTSRRQQLRQRSRHRSERRRRLRDGRDGFLGFPRRGQLSLLYLPGVLLGLRWLSRDSRFGVPPASQRGSERCGPQRAGRHERRQLRLGRSAGRAHHHLRNWLYECTGRADRGLLPAAHRIGRRAGIFQLQR